MSNINDGGVAASINKKSILEVICSGSFEGRFFVPFISQNDHYYFNRTVVLKRRAHNERKRQTEKGCN